MKKILETFNVDDLFYSENPATICKGKTPKEYLESVDFGYSMEVESLVASLKESYSLSDEVLNVFLDYAIKNKKRPLPFYWKDIVDDFKLKGITTSQEAVDYIISWEKENIIGIEFNYFEMKHIEKMKDEFDLKYSVLFQIIQYGNEVNYGLVVYWFVDRVASFVAKHNPKSNEATKDLIKTFHEKYVVPFGK